MDLVAVFPDPPPPDLARTLDVSELSLTLSRLGDGVTLLEPAWDKLMPRLGELGEVMGLTRNEACVIEKHGHWAPFSMAGPATGLVLWFVTGSVTAALAGGIVFGAISSATDPASTGGSGCSP
jgi:putative heme degradation protein